MNDINDFTFTNRDDARRSWEAANKDWAEQDDGAEMPRGKIIEVHFPDGIMEAKEGTNIFVVVTENGEYMVANDHQGGNRWVCMA